MMAPNTLKGFGVIVLVTAVAVWLVVPLINKGINKVTGGSSPSA